MNARRTFILAAVAAGTLLCAASAPHFLRQLRVFRVRNVEVLGTRMLAPKTALETSGIDSASSVFDDPAPWRDSLLAHPLVAEAHIARRPPGTVVIEVVETVPVALVRTPVLRPVDARGRLLPMEPAFGDQDHPVLGGVPETTDAAVTDERVLRTLQGLAAVRVWQPLLWPWISEAHAGRDHMRLLLRWPESAELLLPLPVDSAGLEHVRLVIADLAATGGPGQDGELARLRRLDARFHEQVLVTLDRDGNRKRGTG